MAQNNPMWEVEYATYYMKLHDERKAGKEEGLKEGLKQGLEKDMIQKLISQGKSVENIADLFGMTVEEVQQLLEWKA